MKRRRCWPCRLRGLGGLPGRHPRQCPGVSKSKPIHIIVSVSAGGSIDTIARSIGEALSQSTGQPVVIENRPGANGNIAAAAVARAAPDGYTLLATGGSTLNLNPFLYRDCHSIREELHAVTLTARTNFILVVNPKLGVDTVEAFVALAKAQSEDVELRLGGQRQPDPDRLGAVQHDDGHRDQPRALQGAGARR